jgi:hypothetical protein
MQSRFPATTTCEHVHERGVEPHLCSMRPTGMHPTGMHPTGMHPTGMHLARPLVMMPSMQMLMFLRSPCGRIHFFGTAATGLLARPFSDPMAGFVREDHLMSHFGRESPLAL